MDKPRPGFSLDELLAQLKAEECVDGYTYRELCELAGIPQTGANIRKVRGRIGDQRALGRWEKVGMKTHWSGLLQKEVTAEAFRPKEEGGDVE